MELGEFVIQCTVEDFVCLCRGSGMQRSALQMRCGKLLLRAREPASALLLFVHRGLQLQEVAATFDS